MPLSCADRWLAWLNKLGSLARDFMVGTAYSWLSTMHTVRHQGALERIFILSGACEFMGVPLLPAPYGLRLLPYLEFRQNHREKRRNCSR